MRRQRRSRATSRRLLARPGDDRHLRCTCWRTPGRGDSESVFELKRHARSRKKWGEERGSIALKDNRTGIWRESEFIMCVFEHHPALYNVVQCVISCCTRGIAMPGTLRFRFWSVISVLYGVGDRQSRAMSLRGRSTGIASGQYSENTYRWHDVRLERGARVDLIVSYQTLSMSCCTICGAIVTVVDMNN